MDKGKYFVVLLILFIKVKLNICINQLEWALARSIIKI